MPDLVRINKFVAMHSNIGRRQADMFIEQGRVLVNGQKATLGTQINPANDVILVDGKPLANSNKTSYLYVLLNKPVGYVCSRRQQDGSPTIYSLLPEKYHHLKPVGRLDKDSSGLLLLTNDGEAAHHLMHPSFIKQKQYEVTLDKPLEASHRELIDHQGVVLPDGPSRLRLERLADGRRWLVTMHEGRNRQIRRTFLALGYTVVKLNRTQFGSMSIQQLNNQLFVEVAKPNI
ncbi:MAG TPA: pseudouridine synthase [Candidatus Acidoferrum sp.]|nr:pseudouridine synthase [Candidatus Acidoferrum sp.]